MGAVRIAAPWLAPAVFQAETLNRKTVRELVVVNDKSMN